MTLLKIPFGLLKPRSGAIRFKGQSVGGESQKDLLALGIAYHEAAICLILIDEPSIGLSQKIIGELFQLLRQLTNNGTTALMAEQNVRSALKIPDCAVALNTGLWPLTVPLPGCWWTPA